MRIWKRVVTKYHFLSLKIVYDPVADISIHAVYKLST